MINRQQISLRTITYSLDLNCYSSDDLQNFKNSSIYFDDLFLSNFNSVARTKRISILPCIVNTEKEAIEIHKRTQTLTQQAKSYGFRWVNLPLILTSQSILSFSDLVRKLILTNDNLFISLYFKDISSYTLEIASKSILKVSRISRSGIDSFRLGVAYGELEGCPFFPYAYFTKPNSFSLGLESLNLLNILKDDELNPLSTFVQYLSEDMNLLKKNCLNPLLDTSDLNFMGIDASLAPFPREKFNLVEAFRKLGILRFGAPGTLTRISQLTLGLKSSIKNSGITPVGFNGCMLSVIEDDGLAEIAFKQEINIDKLMLYSTVCGCGIDMVPVAGGIHIDTIMNMILDIIELSKRHSKPLGLRILPQSGLSSNESSSLCHDFLTDTRIFNTLDSISIVPY